jgi:hypothetical protein
MTLGCFAKAINCFPKAMTRGCFPKAMNCQQRKRQMSEFLSLVEDMLHRGRTHTHLCTDNVYNARNAAHIC